MAINNLGSFSGRILSYDTSANEYIINPEGENLALIAAGYNNTRLTQVELAAEHDGNTTFTGRPDYVGDVEKYPFVITDPLFTLTQPNEFKIYVDRDPALSYADLSTVAETDVSATGYKYDATIQVYFGQVYFDTFQYEMQFTQGLFETYQFNIPYTDPDTNRSNSILVDVVYKENSSAQLIIPKMISDATFAVQVFDASPTQVYDAKNKVFSDVIGTAVYDIPENPTYTDNVIEGNLGMPYNDPVGSRCGHVTSEGDGVWLTGSENLMRPETSWSASFWFPPGDSAFTTVVSKHGEDALTSATGFSHWADITIQNNTVKAYFGGEIISIPAGSDTYNNCVTLSVECISAGDYNVNAWLNGVQEITNQSESFANLRDLNRPVSLFARSQDDTIGAAFEASLVDKWVTNITLFDYAITAEKAGQIYRNQDNSIILGFSGDSNLGFGLQDYGYVTKTIENMRQAGYPIRAFGIAFSGLTSYDFGPTEMEHPLWLSAYGQTRPAVTSGISSDRLVGEYGCDVLIPAESSNFSMGNYLYQEFDDGDASGGEYIHNIGEYQKQATSADIAMIPLGCLPVDSITLKRNVKWSEVQWNVYNEAKAVYPDMMDTMTWSSDAGNDYRTKTEYIFDTQHHTSAFHQDLADGSIKERFDPIGLTLLEDMYPSLETQVPVILPENIRDGDNVQSISGDNVPFEFYAFNGDIHGNELQIQNHVLSAGENVVTLSFTDQWANYSEQIINVNYGDSGTSVIGEWAMDAIAPTTYEVTDTSTFDNHFEVYGSSIPDKDEITITSGGRMNFPASVNAKLLIPDSTDWFPFEEEYGVMGWLESNDVTTFQSIMGRGGNSLRRNIGITSASLFVNNTGGGGQNVPIGPVLTTGVRRHICIQLRTDVSATSNIGMIFDCYVDGAYVNSLDEDWFNNVVFQNTTFGGLSNNPTSDNFDSLYPLDGIADNWKYRNSNWTAQEITDIYNAEL